jgi:virginiamycin B lyase
MRGRARLIPVLVLAIAAGLAGSAEAKPRLAGVFDLTGVPGQIARGPDGNVWVVLSGSSENNTLARIRPNGNVTEYSPDDLVNPEGISAGPDGNLWATRNGGVVKIPPDNPDDAQAFDIAAIGSPQEIISGPGSKLWTASDDRLVNFEPANPTEFIERTIDGMSARGIATSGRRLWIADFAQGDIHRVKPGGPVKSYNVDGGPQDVAKGPRKGAAYTNQQTDPHTVGRILPPAKPRRTKVPDTDPFGITFAADRNWWIANFASHNLTILNQEGRARRFRKLPDNSGPRYVTSGPNNTVWVSLETSQQVARIKGVKR